MSNDNLMNYYKTNFAMVQHHKYSLAEIEDMMPFEREVYIMLLTEYIKEENERVKQEQQKAKSSRPRRR